jgi:hypothetical protein
MSILSNQWNEADGAKLLPAQASILAFGDADK